MGPFLIAEVKTQSPFGYKSVKSWDELFSYANEHGDWLSIHTDPRWGGSFAHVKRARELAGADKIILAKGIHASDDDIAEAINAGANYALVVGRKPAITYRASCLFEPNSVSELDSCIGFAGVVWNSRDLATGELKTQTFKQAKSAYGFDSLIQASNIRTFADVFAGASAVLVGEHLESYVNSIKYRE